MTRAAFGFALVFSACSGTGNDEPIDCDRAERTGTYLLRYTRLSGACAELGTELGQFENGALGETANCSYGAPTFSADECTVTQTASCNTSGGSSIWSAELVQTSDDGSELSGTATVRLLDTAGNETCRGSYRVTATRETP